MSRERDRPGVQVEWEDVAGLGAAERVADVRRRDPLAVSGRGRRRRRALHRAEPWAEAAHCPANRTERRELGLGAQQARMCRRVPELMPFIVGAAAQSVQVCQKAFALRRWTCASAALAPHLKADLTRGGSVAQWSGARTGRGGPGSVPPAR